MNNTGEYSEGGVVEDSKRFENKGVKNERITIYLKWRNKVTVPVVVTRLIHYYYIAAVVVILCIVVEVTPT